MIFSAKFFDWSYLLVFSFSFKSSKSDEFENANTIQDPSRS